MEEFVDVVEGVGVGRILGEIVDGLGLMAIERGVKMPTSSICPTQLRVGKLGLLPIKVARVEFWLRDEVPPEPTRMPST